MDQFKSSLKNIKTADFIIWTGDNTDHGIYNNAESSTKATKLISEYFDENMPESVIFGIHGNHEIAPVSLQNFTMESDPVANILAEIWKKWLSKEAYEELKNNTFYSMLLSEHPKISPTLKSKLKNTRIIAYNSQN